MHTNVAWQQTSCSSPWQRIYTAVSIMKRYNWFSASHIHLSVRIQIGAVYWWKNILPEAGMPFTKYTNKDTVSQLCYAAVDSTLPPRVRLTWLGQAIVLWFRLVSLHYRSRSDSQWRKQAFTVGEKWKNPTRRLEDIYGVAPLKQSRNFAHVKEFWRAHNGQANFRGDTQVPSSAFGNS